MEYLQLFDEEGNELKEKIARSDKFNIEKGKYFKIILLIIENEKHEFLIEKTSNERNNVFAFLGGHVTYGDSNIKTVIKEAKEELGIDIKEYEIKFVDTIKHDIAYCDTFYTHKNINLKDIKVQEEEVDSVYWMSKEEIFNLDKKGEFRHSNIQNFKKVLDYLKKVK
ncbi:MAG: NUDIX hydrolase [bacterium]|nr:NUDIX hydrolase [bacterium]